MRFILGVLIGYTMRGKKRLLITTLATLAFIVFIVIPTIAMVTLRLNVEQERRSRPPVTKVPSVKGLTYKAAETKLQASHLKIHLLANRYDLALQSGIIVDQTPQAGEAVEYEYTVGVTVVKSGPPTLAAVLSNQSNEATQKR